MSALKNSELVPLYSWTTSYADTLLKAWSFHALIEACYAFFPLQIFIWSKNIHVGNWRRIDRSVTVFSFHPLHLQGVQFEIARKPKKLQHTLDWPLIVTRSLQASLQYYGLNPWKLQPCMKKMMNCLADGNSKIENCKRSNPRVVFCLPKPLSLLVICQDNLGAFPNAASQSLSI